MKRRLILAAAVLSLVLAFAARPAHASGVGIGGVRVSGVAARSTTTVGCKTVTVWRGFRTLVGLAWRYQERISWCWARRRITSFGYRRWATVRLPTWFFEGHVGFSGYGGRGHWAARRFTQGQFRQCAQWCVQTRLPWVDLLVRANGSYAYATGG